MKSRLMVLVLSCVAVTVSSRSSVSGNPWNGKVLLQAFWWDCLNSRYQTDPDGTGGWYTYLAKLAPRLRDMGFDGIWLPSPCKGENARGGMGYDLYDHYDLGNKFQSGLASRDTPLYLEFQADREGYYQLAAKLAQATEAATRAYLKVEYEAPRTSSKF